MKRELGEIPPRGDIVQILVREYEKLLAPLTPAELDNRVVARMKELEKSFTSERFLFKKTRKKPKGIKIRGGVEIRCGIHKANGGLIRTVEEVEEERISDIGISGDFQFHPKDDLTAMEVELRETEFQDAHIRNKIEQFYEEHRIQAPGVTPEDFTTAIMQSQSEGNE